MSRTAVTLRRITLMMLGLIVVTAGLTTVFLGMRAVMEIGGSCASGGPYAIVRPCPTGVAWLIPVGILGGLAGLGAYASNVRHLPGPRLTLLAWPALFLSLGWNFWEYGLNPPAPVQAPEWGWIICGVVFVLMGGLPLAALASPGAARHMFWADAPSEGIVDPARGRPPMTIPTRPNPPPPVTAPARNTAAALERVTRLHRDGSLTDAEFANAKRKILEED